MNKITTNYGRTAHYSGEIDYFVRIFELGYRLGFSDSEEGVHVDLKELALQCALQSEKGDSVYLKDLIVKIS